jgi:glycosyltransferase 2 family protein
VHKPIRLGLGIALAAIFLWLMLRHIDVNEIGHAFAKADLWALSLAVAAFSVGLGCKIERWRRMLLQTNGELTWADCYGPMVASVATNNVLPFRAGDIMRGFGFNGRLGINASVSLTTIVVERLLDLLIVISFLGLALITFGTDSSRVIGVGGGVLLGSAVAILSVLLFPRMLRPLLFWGAGLIARLFPGLGSGIKRELEKIFAALEYTAKSRTMCVLIAWSLLAWTAEGCAFWFTAMAMQTIEAPTVAWFALPAATLSTMIPSTPGYVGTFDYFTAQAMTVGGNTLANSVAYAFLVHLVLWLPPTLAGGLYLFLNPPSMAPVKS